MEPVESGEGIESDLPVSLLKRIYYEWNPVKELKVFCLLDLLPRRRVSGIR